MRIAAVVAVLLVGGCFSGDAHECIGNDGVTVLCPAATECHIVGDVAVCAMPDQLAACDQIAEGAACSTGVCHDGICLPVVCGDGRVDAPEQCDTALTDRCSADCRSDLTCPNGVVDPGEQCDDGNTDSHDGCDADCHLEIPRWVSLSDQPVARLAPAMAFDGAHGNIVMFGGASDGNSGTPAGDLGDTWIYENNAWRKVEPLSSPSARHGHAMAYDGKTRRVYLFGGSSNDVEQGDLWAWDGIAWSYVPVQQPPPREGAAMVYDAHRQVLVMVGGANATGLLGDTWEFTGDKWVAAPGLAIPRWHHMLAYDAQHANVVLFGGTYLPASTGTSPILGDTLLYTGGTWTDVSAGTKPPLDPRTDAAIGFDGTRVVMTGGQFDVSNNPQQISTWDGAQWTSVTGGDVITDPGIAFDSSLGGGLVMFGGSASSRIIFEPTQVTPHGGGGPTILGATDVTQRWDGMTWTELPQLAVSLGRAGAALDLATGHGFAFGGAAATNVAYEFIGSTWTATAAPDIPIGGPTTRHGAALAFDEVRGEIVMFGGADAAASDVATTFTWNGGWIPKATTGPAPRTDHAMAYDAKRKLAVMFGGQLAEKQITDETWTWDGAAWTRATGPAPMPRFGHALAYDRTRQQIVMFGGALQANKSMVSDETWLLDATGWHAAGKPPGAVWPSARVGTAMAWDPTRRKIVLFGGQSQILEQDTWEWDGRVWTQIPVLPPPSRVGAVIVGTGDGLVLTGGLSDYQTTLQNPLADLNATSDVWLLRYEGARLGSSCRDATDDDGDQKAGCDDPDCWLTCHPFCMPGDTCDASRPHCGDGSCDTFESQTPTLCPQDCSVKPACGNGTCDPGENPALGCAGDCP